MTEHQCLLCMGSNTDRFAHLAQAREALCQVFCGIRFGEIMETEAIGQGFRSPFSNQLAQFTTHRPPESIHTLLKEIEKACGRKPEDKGQGIVKIDIDLLMMDKQILKPEDMERDYIRQGLGAFR